MKYINNKPLLIFVFYVVFALPITPCLAQFSLTAYLGDTNRSRAGGAAVAEDATTVFTNPAGMSLLSGDNWVFASETFFSSAKFKNQGSKDVVGAPLSGGNGGDGGGATFVPALYYSRSVDPDSKWSFGLAVNSPFGLSTEYDKNWVGRYNSITSSIASINLNPSVSYQFNNQWSAGFGIDLQYVDAKLSSAVDFGAICYGILGPGSCIGLGLQPQNADGLVEIKGDDWSSGYNVGVLWSDTDVRVGFSYRSAIKHRLKGKADFTNPPQAAAFAPLFTDTDVKSPITMPEIISLSVAYSLNAKYNLMADLTQTRWSRIKHFKFEYTNPSQPEQILDKNWKDTTRIAVGMDYMVDPTLIWQFGVAYEPSAIPDDTFDPSIPISNAIWINAGANYQFRKSMAVNCGLVHIIFHSRDVDLTGTYGENLKGKAESGLNVLNAQLIWHY